uniref:Uncharacterized protein n=1 Tax=Glossina brevipalpis TaxID=37001 RepID=A0A1A9W4K1_9MUSC
MSLGSVSLQPRNTKLINGYIMAILDCCCCCDNVWYGSVASAIYTMQFRMRFTLNMCHLTYQFCYYIYKKKSSRFTSERFSEKGKDRICNQLQVYSSISSLVLYMSICEEWEYLTGKRDRPRSKTIIEKGIITETQVRLNIALFICSVSLVISSVLMICGLFKNNENFHLEIDMPATNTTAAPLKQTYKSNFPAIIEEMA